MAYVKRMRELVAEEMLQDLIVQHSDPESLMPKLQFQAQGGTKEQWDRMYSAGQNAVAEFQEAMDTVQRRGSKRPRK